jgi:hypothetical protein
MASAKLGSHRFGISKGRSKTGTTTVMLYHRKNTGRRKSTASKDGPSR